MGLSKTKSNTKDKSTIQNNTLTENKKQNIFEYAVVNILSLIVFIAFGYIAVMSFFQTSVIDPNNYGNEVILFQGDSVVLNLLFISIFTVFVFKMKRHYDFFAKVNMRFMEIVLAAFAGIIGLIWVLSVWSVPAADSQNIFETATQAAQGNYNSLTSGSVFYNSDYYGGHSYYDFYPFQLGFVFICEMIYRIFGTTSSMPIQIINVLCVAVSYVGIAKITKLLFKKRSIEFIAIMLLAGCIQPILFCTFVYGNIIGMCCAVWASYFLIKYFQTNKYILLIPCGALLVVATLAKYNNMIYLVAFVIMLILHTIKAKKWQSIAFALVICIATVGASNLVIMSYESRAHVNLSGGVPQSLYLDMGINESYMAPGWYNGIAHDLYLNSGCNAEIAQSQAWSDINSRLNTMGSNPNYAIEFFGNKILSQWNEPSFESVWISEVKAHTYTITGIGASVYDGSTGQFLDLYFNFYMQIIYILFAVGIYCLFLKRKTNIETTLLPLILLGAFGYHLLFEGKSQYILTYIILLIPTASFALDCILNGKYTKVKKFVEKLKHIPEKDIKAEN